MKVAPLVATLLVSVLLVLGCTSDDAADDGGDADGATGTAAEAGSDEEAGTGPTFDGDPDSPFCQASRDGADRPVLDPFAPGLDPEEVELRFAALAQRFRGFAAVAPDALADDLDLLVASFDELEGLLEQADYDFTQLVEAELDVSVFDDPALGAWPSASPPTRSRSASRPLPEHGGP